jgi:hypothetical protein
MASRAISPARSPEPARTNGHLASALLNGKRDATPSHRGGTVMRTMTRAAVLALLLCLCPAGQAAAEYVYYDANGQVWIIEETPDMRYEDDEAAAQQLAEAGPVATPPARIEPFRYYWEPPAGK